MVFCYGRQSILRQFIRSLLSANDRNLTQTSFNSTIREQTRNTVIPYRVRDAICLMLNWIHNLKQYQEFWICLHIISFSVSYYSFWHCVDLFLQLFLMASGHGCQDSWVYGPTRAQHKKSWKLKLCLCLKFRKFQRRTLSSQAKISHSAL